MNFLIRYTEESKSSRAGNRQLAAPYGHQHSKRLGDCSSVANAAQDKRGAKALRMLKSVGKERTDFSAGTNGDSLPRSKERNTSYQEFSGGNRWAN